MGYDLSKTCSGFYLRLFSPRQRRSAKISRGLSPIIATIFLCTIAIVAVAIMSPFISSSLSSPVSSVAVTKAVLVKQDNYVLLIVNVKNTGSSTLNLQCILYDSGMNPYPAGGAQVVQPHGAASFVLEDPQLGSEFLVGAEYRIDINDANYGRMAEVRVFCMGR